MYRYEDLRPKLFTEEGTKTLLEIRDKADIFLKDAGAFMSGRVLRGDSWLALAALDYMVEIGEIEELTHPKLVAGQHRVFIRAQRPIGR